MRLTVQTAVGALKAVAEPTRLRVLVLLSAGELNVKDLTRILGQSQPRISRHLKLLAEAGMVERFREGSWAYFHVSDRSPGGRLALDILSLVDGADRRDPAGIRRMVCWCCGVSFAPPTRRSNARAADVAQPPAPARSVPSSPRGSPRRHTATALRAFERSLTPIGQAVAPRECPSLGFARCDRTLFLCECRHCNERRRARHTNRLKFLHPSTSAGSPFRSGAMKRSIARGVRTRVKPKNASRS